MKHFILGTAGHVDHGKTTLVKALTGIECDTHKEEKERGLTINLGFAHLDCSDGVSAGVVDVPGHRDFVHTMVAGMGGVDVALLVIAADSGVMPQTLEHLEIMDMLGVKAGIVALTRVDLADDTMAALAEAEVRETLRETFLEDCPIIRTSSVTGEGIDHLKEMIGSMGAALVRRDVGDVFRMFADRSFVIDGFGTVFTGSVLSGSISTGQDAYVLPGQTKPCRVRRLERHHGEVASICAGDRGAVNLAGFKPSHSKGRYLISDRPLRDTRILDVEIRLTRKARGMKKRGRASFHVGTFCAAAEIRLLDCDELGPSASAIARIRLGTPVIARHGDQFVLRDPSMQITFGGGTVLDAAPIRRSAKELLPPLHAIREGGLPALVAAEVRKSGCPMTPDELAVRLNMTSASVRQALDFGVPETIVSLSDEQSTFIVPSEWDQLTRTSVRRLLTRYHKENPLVRTGLSSSDLASELGFQHASPQWAALPFLLMDMTEEGVLAQDARTWRLESHAVVVDPEAHAAISTAETILRDSGMRGLSVPVFEELCAERQAVIADTPGTLEFLVASGRAYEVEGHYLHAGTVDRGREALLDLFRETPEGITPARFRDRLKANRKIAMLLLSIFDRERLTRRSGDRRVLTDQASAKLEIPDDRDN